MVDLWFWAQFGKIGFKSPFGNPLPQNTKKDEQKKQDSSLTDEKKAEQPSSFQWAENLVSDVSNARQKEIDKLNSDENYRQQKIKEYKQDSSKASAENVYELGWGQYLKDVGNMWKEKNRKTEEKKKADEEEAKKDGKYTFWEYLWVEAKDTLRKWRQWVTWVLWTWVKTLQWLWDVAWNWVTDLSRWKAETWQQERITKMLADQVKEDVSVKQSATDRAISNTKILESKNKELYDTVDSANKENAEYEDMKSKLAEQVSNDKNITVEAAVQMVEDAINGKVSWPERDTNYLATVNALKSKKTSLAQKEALFYQKMDEYEKLQEEHQMKEYELSPYTDNYYETEEEAARYKALFWDKLYKKEDWTLYWLNDQKEKDIKWILKGLEWTMFSELWWIYDEKDKDKSLTQWVELRNSTEFLTKAYDTFSDIKGLLENNYDQLCDIYEDGSWNAVKVLNQDKVAALLQQHKDWLNWLSDYILNAKRWTKYIDWKTDRYRDENNLDLWPHRRKKLSVWKDLLFTKLKPDTQWWYRYDKPRDWINKATDNFWVWDYLRELTCENPVQSAYVVWSMYLAIFWKLKYVTKSWKMMKMAEGLNKTRWITTISKSMATNKKIDYLVRKWIGILDETLVSLPLDLWLNDWTAKDLWLNVVFNTLWGLWKIQNADDLTLFKKTLTRQWSPEAMKKYFIEYTNLPEMANKIDWNKAPQEIMDEAWTLIDTHFNSLIASDANKAAWYMSQYISNNIDLIKWENLDEVEALTKSITQNGNIWASLANNKSKNINKIITDAQAKLAKTNDWTQILTIQNKAAKDVRNELKGLLDSFDVDTLNKLYNRKFVSDKIGQAFSNFIEDREGATWIPKADLMLVFMEAMNKKWWMEWATVVDLFKQRVVQGLADWSIKSTKWAKAWVKWVAEIAPTNSEAMATALDIAKIWEDNPEQAARMLSKADQDWIHDIREWARWLSPEAIAKEEEQVAKDLEKTKAWIEATKNEKIEKAKSSNAKEDNAELVKKLKENSADLEWMQKQLKDLWADVVWQAEIISKDPELQKRIADAEEAYKKENLLSSKDDDMEEMLKAEEQKWRDMYEEDAENAGLELDEYLRKNELQFEWSPQQKIAIERYQKANAGKETAFEGLTTDKKRNIVEQFLQEKYWLPFDDKSYRAELQKMADDLRAKSQETWTDFDYFRPISDSSVEQKAIWNKLQINVTKDKKYVVEWDLSKLTEKEAKIVTDLMGKYWVEWPITEENLLKTIDNMYQTAGNATDQALKIEKKLLKDSFGINNPYRKFSTLITNYIEDARNANPVAANLNKGIITNTSLESQFLKNWDLEDIEKDTLLNSYKKILEKTTWNENVSKKMADDASTIEERTIKGAEKWANEETAKAEQVALRMTQEIKKKWLEQSILNWVDDLLNFFDDNQNLMTKTKLLDSLQTITKNMGRTEKMNYLWSLWKSLKDALNGKVDNAVLNNLSQSIIDSWPKSVTNKIIDEVKKWISNWNKTYDVVKLKEFTTKPLYEANKTKWTNQLNNWEVDKTIKEVIQLRVSQFMANTVGEADRWVTNVNDAINNILQSSAMWVKNDNIMRATTMLWKQSTSAMEMYWRLTDTVVGKTSWKTFADVAGELVESNAKSSIANKSAKRVAAEKKQNALAQVEEVLENEKPVTELPVAWEVSAKGLGNIQDDVAESIKKNEEIKWNLTSSEKKVESRAMGEDLTEKEKTLVRMWAVEEAQKIMEAISKWKVPDYISAEFLDWDWFNLFNKLLDFKSLSDKEFELFYKSFLNNRKEVQWLWYKIFHWLKEWLYDWTSTLRTHWNWYTLNDLLEAIPSRVTWNLKWRNWWVIYDPAVTATKYMMESNPVEMTQKMTDALSEYFKTALAKGERSEMWKRFLQAFKKEASDLDMPHVAAEEFMNLYNNLAKRIKSLGIDDRAVQDMLNPMFYNPLEYVKGIWMNSMSNIEWLVLQWEKSIENMVLGTIFRKYEAQGNTLPSEVLDLYRQLSQKVAWDKTIMDFFEKFAWGSLIRNKNALEFWDSLRRYFASVDSLPMWREQFAEWINKSLSHVVWLWDEITRKVSALDSLMNPLYDLAKKTLDDAEYSKFLKWVDDFLFTEQWALKTTKQLWEGLEEFKSLVKKMDLNGWATDEVMQVLEESIKAKELWENRVITNYLYDRVTKDSEAFLEQTWKTPDKFNPADIINRKNLQEQVRERYNQESAKDLIQQITSKDQRRVKKYTRWDIEWTVISNEQRRKNKATLLDYWWSEEETQLAENIVEGVDMEKLLENGELPPETAMKQVLKRIVENWEDYEKLMNEKGFFRDWVRDSVNKTFDTVEKNSGKEYYVIGKNWEFVLRQEADEMNLLQRRWAKLAVKWNVLNKDRESSEIVARIQRTKESWYVISNIDFGKILKKDKLKTQWAVWLQSFLSMSKMSVYELAGKIKDSVKQSVIEEAVNRVFLWWWDRSRDINMATPEAKALYDFLSEYKRSIDKMRDTLDMGDIRMDLFRWTDFTKWVAENKLANRISWMWNYMSAEDIARLWEKYDKSADWVNWVWKNFTKNIIYNARADLSDNVWWRFANALNWLSQKYAIAKNYSVLNITKAGQQVVSNLLHSSWILKSTYVAGTSQFDDLFKVFQNSSMSNLWFDIFESEWKYWERILDKAATSKEKKLVYKDWNYLKNSVLFAKDFMTSNALMRWDRLTQKWAVKSSLALASDDIYKLWWAKWVEDFTKRVDKYNTLLDKYWINERDLMDKERFFKKMNNLLDPSHAKWLSRNASPVDVKNYFAKVNEDREFMYNFYRNEYAPFMGKARTSMGTFFVADNIKELGSIELIDNNKYMFWLMKWSVGKIWEYMYDIWSAVRKTDWTKRSFLELMEQPIFKRLFSEMFEWAHAMWEVEKLTNHEFTRWDGMKAICVPVAAVWMLFWEAMIDLAYDVFDSKSWEEGWLEFVKHAFNTTISSVADTITDRAFIYLGMMMSDIWAAQKTAWVVWKENMRWWQYQQDFRRAFMNTWASRFFYKGNPLYKFTHIRSSWYSTPANELLNTSTILAEIWLNQTSSARQKWNDTSEKIYDLSKNVYEDNDTFADKASKYIPALKNMSKAWVDMSVLFPMLEEKVDNLWIRWFLKTTTSRTELARLINNMEKNAILSDSDFQNRVQRNMWTFNKDNDEEVKMAMIKAWKYKDNLVSWNIVTNWLSKTDLYGKWESTLWLEMMSDEDRNSLYEQFNNLYQTYVIDKKKADVATNAMFDKFVLAATKYGWSMSMAGYMWAYATAYKAAAREYYWLKSAEVSAWNKWDEWLAAEVDIDLEHLPESKYGNYLKYVDDVRQFELGLIVDNWDVLSKERSIQLELFNKYIETDKDNFWWKSYVGNIWDEDSNMSKLWNTLTYNEIAKDQWLPWMVVPVAYQEKKASDAYTKAMDKAKTPEEKAEIWEKFLSIQNSLWQLADKYVDNPQAVWLIKASLASWIVAFADKIKERDPEMLGKLVDIIGEKAINKVLNSLTDSPTVTMADAFELATGVSAHPWSGSWSWRSASIPSAKARENYVNKMLIPNYNKAKAYAAATSGDGPSLPKFTTGYGRAKDGSIVTAQIPVPTRKNVTRTYDTPTDTKTAKLDVAPLPVKEWRIIGWKYTARAIQNAKVYSRRIGK